jgi:hypothetical protein
VSKAVFIVYYSSYYLLNCHPIFAITAADTMQIKDAKVYPLSDLAALAQAKIQQQNIGIDPVIGISHRLREAGFDADMLTIENKQTDRRILLVLHDDRPDTVDVEFGRSSEDPRFDFQQLALSALTEALFSQWMLEQLGKQH